MSHINLLYLGRKNNIMSHFIYDTNTSKAKKKGIYLRPNKISNPTLMKDIHNSRQLRLFDQVWKIEIIDIEDGNAVLLQIWSTNLIDVIRKKVRNNVFHLRISEDEKWVCEGDLGKGLT